jgi:hypothetical protein
METNWEAIGSEFSYVFKGADRQMGKHLHFLAHHRVKPIRPDAVSPDDIDGVKRLHARAGR